jgi:hypothetical protein
LPRAAHAQSQIFVERREGLVEKEHAGVGDEGAGECHALLLPTGQLRREPVGEALHAYLGQQISCLPMAFGLAGAAQLKREGDVVEHAAVRKQRVALKHHRRTALHRR